MGAQIDLLPPDIKAVILAARAWAAAYHAPRGRPPNGPAHQALPIFERTLLDAVAALERRVADAASPPDNT